MGTLPGNAGNCFTAFRAGCGEGGAGQGGKDVEMGKAQQTSTRRVQTTGVLV